MKNVENTRASSLPSPWRMKHVSCSSPKHMLEVMQIIQNEKIFTKGVRHANIATVS